MRPQYLDKDLKQRLEHGYVFYNGEPFFIHLVGNKSAILTNTRRDMFEVLVTDPLLDIAAPEVGFINYKGKAYFIERLPSRIWKQSLESRSLYQTDIETKITGTILNELFRSSSFEQMLIDQYPTVDTLLKSLNEGKVTSMAIAKDVALTIDKIRVMRVYYRKEPVGFIKPNTNIVIIPKGDNAWIVSRYLETFSWKVQ